MCTSTVEAGEIVAVIGPNGAGKSTLLKTIAGLLHPARGSITLRGAPIHGLPPREVSRRGIAFVPQEQNIFASLSVRENLEMGGWLDPARDAPAHRSGVRALSDARRSVAVAPRARCRAGSVRCWRWRWR